MIISKITRQKRRNNRFSVFIDGAYAFSVSDENLIKLRLKEGNEIDEDKIEQITTEEEKKNAIETVWRLLKIRSRSEREIVDKLRLRKISTEGISYALMRIKELGYINDAKFARDRVSYLRQKGKGTELIKMELRKLGINGDIIRDLLSNNEFSEEAEIEQIKNLALIRLKRMGEVDPKTVSNRLIGFLARRGFNINSIREGLKKAKLQISEE